MWVGGGWVNEGYNNYLRSRNKLESVFKLDSLELIVVSSASSQDIGIEENRHIMLGTKVLRWMLMARHHIVRLEREGGGSLIWSGKQRFERKRAKITLHAASRFLQWDTD